MAAGIRFTVRAADIDESARDGETAKDLAMRVSREKALAAECDDDEIVLAADTVVTIDSEIMGKPVDGPDAARMLRLLSGRRHDVVTGICVRSGDRMVSDVASTGVWFAPLSDEDIRWYVESGEPMDKAGAYGIQGLASRFIPRIEGSYSNVVGLPVELVWRRLQGLARRID